MVCLNCVGVVEVKLRVPKQVYDFFTGELEWNTERFEYEFLEGLDATLDGDFLGWRRAEEVKSLLKTICKGLDP